MMSQWISAWGQAHTDISRLCSGAQSRTVRMSILCPFSGEQIRLRFSNRDGAKPMHICQAAIQFGSQPARKVSFSGRDELELPPAEERYSDPLPNPVQAGEEITISIAFQGGFYSGNQPNEVVWHSKKGNFALAEQMPLAGKSIPELFWGTTPAMPALSEIEVYTQAQPQVIVCLGDSITQQGRWTNPLRDMLRRSGEEFAVINKGISGNRLLSEPSPIMGIFGRSAVSRFQRDVLEVKGASAVILGLGTNDLSMAKNASELAACNADALSAAFTELTEKAKAARLKVYIATITPRTGDKEWTDSRERERIKFNEWVRASVLFDGILDFDVATRSQSNPAILAPCCDSGDHLHPGSIGGRRMAEEAYQKLVRSSSL